MGVGATIFNQSNNVETNNIIMTMMFPLKLSDRNEKELYLQSSPNAPLAHRPLCSQMGKESVSSLRSLESYKNDITLLKSEGILVTKDAICLQVKVKIVGHMLNGKAAKLYTGLGGSYCDLCCYSKEECLDRNLVERGFSITCTIDDLLSLFNELANEEGNIFVSKNDYATRKGLTTKPIATNEVVSG